MYHIRVKRKPIELRLLGSHGACATMGKGARFPTRESAEIALSNYLDTCVTIHDWMVCRVRK